MTTALLCIALVASPAVQWDSTPAADGHRVYWRESGAWLWELAADLPCAVDPMQPEAPPHCPGESLPWPLVRGIDLDAGAEIEVTVTAYNQWGESAKAAPITVCWPMTAR